MPSVPTEIFARSIILSEWLPALLPVEFDILLSKKEKFASLARPGDHPSALAYPRLFSSTRTFFKTSGSCNEIRSTYFLASCIHAPYELNTRCLRIN